jgi:aspartate dehydrogenase
MIHIGLIGFGTIGKAVAKAVKEGRAGETKTVTVLVRDLNKIEPAEANSLTDEITADATRFFSADTSVVIEAAGQNALRQYAERTLRSGREMLAVSVGVLADDSLLSAIKVAAKESQRKLLIPSGALGALDAISAGAMGSIDGVTLVVRKPPAAWKGTPAEETAASVLDAPVCFYQGMARETTRAYPQNVNVLAALSLAGIGFDRTNVKMYVDPTIKDNTFELVAQGEFGELKLELRNRPYPQNPKTGHLVVMSLIKAIRRLQENIIVGF